MYQFLIIYHLLKKDKFITDFQMDHNCMSYQSQTYYNSSTRAFANKIDRFGGSPDS